ncbi:MAG: hypothetical protein HN742_29455 [Lentisphaerae bacterium]|jgi:hypothetical protein|nr:hypothetical protein [Lentisphaerota bacterium]MBT4815571.1 hypothetical protein [Lentisphaerota bacterium]MBT5609024.1 hypothetical protein [Lentisphaerota bacterium]MBT7055456.1 hypothetical protein [Lentisphaerota bacterium]MBT7846035.1 hypothetical protein [Lentisphaerota bacterium]
MLRTAKMRWGKMHVVCVLYVLTLVSRAEPALDVTVTVDLGHDTGQNFGTVFEGYGGTDGLVCGAGFASAYNTYFRSERLKINFFVRPQDDRAAYQLEPLPRAGDDSGAYPHDLGDDVFIHQWKPKRTYRVWDSASGRWRDLPNAAWPGISAATVRGKRLEVRGNHLVYNGQQIFDWETAGGYRYSYYGQGHLFFYHKVKPVDGVTETKEIVAVPWDPYARDLKVDLTKAKAADLKWHKEFPYAWGQLGNEVLNCTNWGGLYAFDGQTWKVLVEADEKTSYQVYSMINYGDRLMMAQYPTGFLICYDGAAVTTLTDWPPVPKGASTSAREAQTTAIYRGELFVGVWPWSELWRRDPDTQAWVHMQRMFTHPPTHATPVHPYETLTKAAKLVSNDLGQRLTALVPYRDGLIVGTSAKGTHLLLRSAGIEDLTQQQLDDYGALWHLRMPGNLASVIAWRDRPTTLRFVVRSGRMSISQDGEELGAAVLGVPLPADLSEGQIVLGDGVFGPLRGKIRAPTPK